MAGNYIFYLVLLLSVIQVFGRDCSKMDTIKNCNECIRCGGHWCNNPKPDNPHCVTNAESSWCPYDRELLKATEYNTVPGKNLNVAYVKSHASVGATNKVLVHYGSTTKQKTSIIITNTTQSKDLSLQTSSLCKGSNCTVTVEAIPGNDFCAHNGKPMETINVVLNINSVDEAVELEYHVPCACQCSLLVDSNSYHCNWNGDYSCGTCSCHNGWTGKFCENQICEQGIRGDDVSNCYNPVTRTECSGNGYCGSCGTCQCFKNVTNYQYFDKDEFCSDICFTINYNGDACLRYPVDGVRCPDANFRFRQYNRTEFYKKDKEGRNIWAMCNVTLDGCYIQYGAMKENGESYVMVKSICNEEIVGPAPAVVEPVKIAIPAIVGILAIVLATAAVAGYMFWKHRSPPLPLMDPQYTNIGAEDCTGVNPLYKPPTSSFTNPTYKK